MEVFDDNSIVFNILLRKSTFSQMFIPLMKGNNLLNEFFSEGLYHSQQIDYVIFHSGGEHQPENFKVIHYMQSHLEDVTLQDIADHFGFSLSYCSRLIKSTTGQSFNSWKRIPYKKYPAENIIISAGYS